MRPVLRDNHNPVSGRVSWVQTWLLSVWMADCERHVQPCWSCCCGYLRGTCGVFWFGTAVALLDELRVLLLRSAGSVGGRVGC